MALTCDYTGMSRKELLNSLLVKNTATGKYGLRYITTTPNCSDLEDGVSCDGPLLEEDVILRMIVDTDECGKPAILLMEGQD